MNLTSIVVAGLIATATADVWQQLLKHGARLPIANRTPIGRWVGAIGRGAFVRAPITGSPPVTGERVIGWMFHYTVGVVYAAINLMVVQALSDVRLSLISALLFGIATLTAPWFALQPVLGFGMMARRLPNQQAVLWAIATTRLAFGLGLYAGFAVAA